MPKTPTQQAEIPNDQALDAIRALVYEALKALMPDATTPELYLEQLYPDRAIVRVMDGALWEYPYTVAAGAVTLGDRQAVQVAYVPAAQASTAGDIRMLQAIDKEGWEWEVLIIQPGLGANRQWFPAEVLQASVAVFEGMQAFCLDETQHSQTGDKSAKQIVGWVSGVEWRGARAAQAGVAASRAGIYGKLTLVPTADWLRVNLNDSHAKGKKDLYGLSVDAPRCKAINKTVQQAEGPVAVQWFTQLFPPASVDVVWRPGTPGGFQRALNADIVQPTTEEDPMKERLLKLLQEKRPDLYAKVNQAEVTEEQLLAHLGEGLTPVQQASAQQAGLSAEDRAVLDEAKRGGWNAKVAQAIVDSKLPEAMQATLRGRYLDHPGEFAAVEQAIKTEKEEWAAISQSGNVRGMGFAHDVAVEGEFERLYASTLKLFGVRDVQSDAPAFSGIRQCYEAITGDMGVSGNVSRFSDSRQRGLQQSARAFQSEAWDDLHQLRPGYARILQAQNIAAWPTILANTLHRRLGQEYALPEYYEDRIISNKRRATDFKNLEVVRSQYPADLPLVSHDDDYTEAATLTDEGVLYKVVKRGRIISITRDTIMNDNLGMVTKLLMLEARAARRTHARVAWGFLINNATYDVDATALFHANHANLGSTALTADATGVAAVVAALNRLAAQTEPGSGEKIAGAWWTMKPQMVVSGALQDKALSLNQSDGIPGTANNGDNPLRGKFGAPDNPERILVLPLLTDATDWYVLRQPADVEMIEMAYLNGQEKPEVFVADQQTIGQMFIADKFQAKIRHEYNGEIVDYRGMDKSVVAG